MANKDLIQFPPHEICRDGTVMKDIRIWETPLGLRVCVDCTDELKKFTIKWSRIRAALRRKDK